jgi:hypothetical protein
MDASLFEKDLVAALKELPKEFVKDAAKVVMSHDLGKFFPTVMARLAPHLRAIFFEGVSGQLDFDELETTIKNAIKTVGIELPNAPAA